MLTLSGLGASNSSDDCAPDEIYDVNEGCIWAGFASEEYLREEAAKKSEPSWWEAPLTDITKGITQGLFQDRGGAGGGGARPALPKAPDPWYATTTGMVGIGAGVVALVLLLRK